MPKDDKQKPRGLGIGGVDVLAIIGLASFTYGCWLIYAPAAFIAFGGALLLAAVASAKRRPF